MLDDYWPDYDKKVRGHKIVVKPDKSRTWNLDALDLDHVYPKSRDGSGFSQTKNQLGNLTLLLFKHNREEAGKLAPTSKRKIEIYTTNGILTTKLLGEDIAKHGWNGKLAEARRKELVAMAEYVYRV